MKGLFDTGTLLQNLNTGRSLLHGVRIEVHTEARFRPDAVNELAVSAAQIQHRGARGNLLRVVHHHAANQIAVLVHAGQSLLVEFLQLSRRLWNAHVAPLL